MKQTIQYFFVFLMLTACAENSKNSIDIPVPKATSFNLDSVALSKEVYHDKVLGALVGSAIGDAMGASTEMWHRDAIQLRYGYITGLTPALRIQSPEGTWDNNLPSGATTDDTRWKFLMTQYFKKKNLNKEDFVDFILSYYQQEIGALNSEKTLGDTDFLDMTVEKIDWIKEWARVSFAHKKGSDAYQEALNRFYGGELSCAGQLYTPMIGLLAESPEDAYTKAYDHALFDIGYAKDISSLVSVMTNVALYTTDIDSIISSTIFVDPMGYQNSRLVGRISYNLADASVNKVLSLKKTAALDSSFVETNSVSLPTEFPRSKVEWALENKVFEYLQENEMAIPFHSGEIWQILITALKFSEGDFEKCMQFIVNYGRDNDTVAAVAGMILGAKDGYSKLPEDIKLEVLETNKKILGIDLETMAKDITELKFASEK